MSDIIKRGRLDVKKKNIFGSAYKNRWVLLRNSSTLNCKTVEILEGEDETEDSRDVIRLNEVWSVHDKSSKNRGRYTFELIKGEDVVLTFSCSTLLERDEWTESLRILNQLALPCHADNQPSPPFSNYFSVTLVKNRSAMEINQSGSYLLSITDSAIVLHWRTGAIAHHWPKRSVVKLLHHPKKEGHLILHAKSSNGDGVMEFEFNAAKENSIQILKTWNNRLLESIPYNPQQINETPSASNEGKKKKGRATMSSKSFRSFKKMSFGNHDSELIRRAESLSKLHKYRMDVGPHAARSSPSTTAMATRISQGGLRIGGLPPLPHEAKVRSWGGPEDQWGPSGGNSSQDSFARGQIRGSPPPLPPRPSERIRYVGNDEDDPDYTYIKEDEIKGPRNSSPFIRRAHSNSSVNDALNELERDIIRENQAKKMEEKDKKRRAMTLGRAQARQQSTSPKSPLRLGPPVVFTTAEPQDYTDFVPSTIRQVKSSSSEPEGRIQQVAHTRSASEPDSHPFQLQSSVLSQPAVFKNDPLQSTGMIVRAESHTPLPQQDTKPASSPPSSACMSNTIPNSEGKMFSTVPSLPPRTWRNASSGSLEGDVTDCLTSAPPSSTAVSGSNGIRCREAEEDHTLQLEEKLKIHGHESSSHTPMSIGDAHTPHISDTRANTSANSEATPSLNSTDSPTIPVSSSPTLALATPPPIPPRSPTKDHLSRQSSSSSTSSNSSTRCPHCRGSRSKQKAMVEKTVSLGNAMGDQSPDNCRKSLPNLAGTNKSVTENGLVSERCRYGLRSRHCSRCSPAASSSDIVHGGVENASSSSQPSSAATTFEYLQLVGEEHSSEEHSSSTTEMETDLDSMDILSSCLKKLADLDNKVNNRMTSLGRTGGTKSSGTTSSSSSPTFSVSASSSVTDGVGSKVSLQSTSSSRVIPNGGLLPGKHNGNMSDLKRSMESELTRAQRVMELTLAGLSQLSHSSSSQTYDTKSTSILSDTPHHKASSSTMIDKATKGQQANGMLLQRGSSTIGTTTPTNLSSSPPTVPPRSMVSLMQQPLKTSPTSKQQPLLNGISSQPNLSKMISARPHTIGTGQAHHSPVYSPATTRPNSTAHTRHASLARRRTDHMENQQSSTVFIHHLKDRRVGGLTHLV